MKTAIMQPTYLPWAGYFSLIDSVDCLVFLDDVQVERQSWQTRNRICLDGHEQMLSVPVRKTGLQTKIKDACVDDSTRWRKKHQKTLRQAYGATSFGKLVLKPIDVILNDHLQVRLADINIDIITGISEILGLSTKFLRASNLKCVGNRSRHLIAICQTIGATSYISPEGSRQYLEEDGFTDRLGEIPMHFHRFLPGPYPQINCRNFIPYLATVDVIANLGPDAARNYLQENAEHV
jgi:hypothetical protein